MVEDEEGPLTDIPVDKAPAVTLCFDKPEEMSAQEGVNVFERTLPASFATEDVRHRARVLFEQGYGYKTVARVVGVSMHTVRDWGRQFKRGLFRESFSASLSRYGSDAHELVWQCHREGLSLRQIARRTGIPVSTCWSWIQKRRELEEN